MVSWYRQFMDWVIDAPPDIPVKIVHKEGVVKVIVPVPQAAAKPKKTHRVVKMAKRAVKKRKA